MSLKSIAVLLDSQSSSIHRIGYAAELACRHDAYLIGMFVVPSGWEGKAASTYVRGDEAILETIRESEDHERAAIDLARRQFDELAGDNPAGSEFRIVHDTDAVEQVVFNALHVDLVVVGPAAEGLPHGLSPELLQLASGVPFMIVPDRWAARNDVPMGRRILLGWNASKESRRAIADSLPLLALAEGVWVIVVNAAGNPRHGEEPGADIARFLGRHGVNVTLAQIESSGPPVAHVILDYAASIEADLVVIGAYSHNRSFETLFGGVTRHLLETAAMPLLIAH